MQDDRAAFEQRNSVVAVARHLAERLFLEVVGRAFCRGIELSHGIGNAGFLERPARAQVADMPFGERRHPLEGADADGSVGIDGHRVFPSEGVQADLTRPSAARSSAAMSIRFIRIIASKARLARAGSASPMSRVSCRGTICQERP